MSHPVLDPLGTHVHARIAELRREAAADGRARAARRAQPTTVSWPATVAAALRETFSRSAASPRPGRPCPTC